MSFKYLPPDVSKKQVNRAGEILKGGKVGSQKYQEALNIANQWRLAHIYPINTFQARLRKMVFQYPGTLVAQRLKRMPTIIDKLDRHKNMKLSTMQDIGGVRAVLKDVNTVFAIVKRYEKSKRFTHLLKEKRDYINKPKPDGYRGVHLVYRYHNTLARNSVAELYEGLMIEVQLRSREQHAWATAVEAMSIILDQPFKTRGGRSDWSEFFELMSSAIAIVEGTSVLIKHEGLTPIELYRLTAEKARQIHALDAMQGYGLAASVIEKGSGGFYNLISLNIKEKKVSITGYAKRDFIKATNDYAKAEQNIDNNFDVVLVSAGKLKVLKKAYPNYFLDLKEFVERVKVIVKEIDSVK
jgi:ppGpp synthetase/RelA/SpoT-type nucleotidyltranferase